MTEYMSLSVSSQFSFLFQDITSLSFMTVTTEGKWCNMISRLFQSVILILMPCVFIDGRNRRQNPFYASRVRGRDEDINNHTSFTPIHFRRSIVSLLVTMETSYPVTATFFPNVLCSLVINYTAIDSQIESLVWGENYLWFLGLCISIPEFFFNIDLFSLLCQPR